MASKKKLNEDNQASDDLQSTIPEPVVAGDPHANRGADNSGNGDFAPKTIDRAAWINGLLNVIMGATSEQLEAMYGSAQQYISPGNHAAAASDKGSTPNMQTLQPGGTTGLPQMPMPTLGESLVSKEMKSLLEDSGLDEDFQDKAALIFEVSVNERVAVLVAEAQDAADKKISEETEELKTSLNETVGEMMKGLDAYATMVAQTWVNENKLAVDSGVKAKLGEDIIKSLRTLVENHNVRFTEEDVPVVEKLEGQLKESADKYNELANTNVALNEQLKDFRKAELIREGAGDLTQTEQARLVELCENVAFDDEASFKKKLGVMKETYIRPKTTTPANKGSVVRLDEEVTPNTETITAKKPVGLDPYRDAARRHASKSSV